ncbi:MAG: 3-deoxy-8-phosphooctulonate synthase [Bacteroidales bacterium]|nr:3-deoxy-8-phosphooctulonate synthase [Bacteroidales bacterium]
MKISHILPNIKYADSANYFLIAGPCVVESEEICDMVASHIVNLSNRYSIPYIFKSSYKKANRSRLDSFTGIGDKEALEILKKIKDRYQVPVLTDIHTPEEAYFAAGYVDVLQIPAFLSRQTELLVAAAKTGKAVNIKKGQFMAPLSMKFALDKVIHSGNMKVMLTDRGTIFGYHDLVVDYRGIKEMKGFGYPVVLDVTHSLQQPNQETGVSGGKPDMIETIALAGIAVGVDGIFIETHPDPDKALSDGTNMLALNDLEVLLEKLLKVRRVIVDFDTR